MRVTVSSQIRNIAVIESRIVKLVTWSYKSEYEACKGANSVMMKKIVWKQGDLDV